MSKLYKSVLIVILLALGFSARAQVILQNEATFSGNSPYSSYQLTIAYEVTLSDGLYTYSYDLSTSPAVKLTSLTIGGSLDPVDTQSVVIQPGGGIDLSLSGASNDSIGFIWDLNPGATSGDVSFTSTNAPTMTTFTLNGDGVEWGSPGSIPAPDAALIPAPAPVPEAPTIFAAVLMILPLGVAGFRALRRDRNPH